MQQGLKLRVQIWRRFASNSKSWPAGRRSQVGGTAYLNHKVFATIAKPLQHAQKEVRGLHQVFKVGLRLLGFVILSQQSQENLPVFHQVKDVAWETRMQKRKETQFRMLHSKQGDERVRLKHKRRCFTFNDVGTLTDVLVRGLVHFVHGKQQFLVSFQRQVHSARNQSLCQRSYRSHSIWASPEGRSAPHLRDQEVASLRSVSIIS